VQEVLLVREELPASASELFSSSLSWVHQIADPSLPPCSFSYGDFLRIRKEVLYHTQGIVFYFQQQVQLF
jgi:hypothetical protein